LNRNLSAFRPRFDAPNSALLTLQGMIVTFTFLPL
jgi:hypothetical protein